MWVSDFVGEAILDPLFNPASVESQLYLRELCADMNVPKDYIIEGTVECWFEDFIQFATNNGENFPIDENNF